LLRWEELIGTSKVKLIQLGEEVEAPLEISTQGSVAQSEKSSLGESLEEKKSPVKIQAAQWEPPKVLERPQP
jgi:hypothetical protein